jgi:hypothetical protein
MHGVPRDHSFSRSARQQYFYFPILETAYPGPMCATIGQSSPRQTINMPGTTAPPLRHIEPLIAGHAGTPSALVRCISVRLLPPAPPLNATGPARRPRSTPIPLTPGRCTTSRYVMRMQEPLAAKARVLLSKTHCARTGAVKNLSLIFPFCCGYVHVSTHHALAQNRAVVRKGCSPLYDSHDAGPKASSENLSLCKRPHIPSLALAPGTRGDSSTEVGQCGCDARPSLTLVGR